MSRPRLARLGDRPPVGRVALVPPGGAGGVDDDGAVEAGIGDEPAHDALGRRRAADVAEAHEQHAVRRHRAVILRWR